jgi:DNA-binding response OmpR family regulator
VSKTIVVIEDEADISELLTTFLEARGFKTKAAKNGAEGVQLVEKTLPDLVLLDIMLPGMDGFEILLKIKSQPKTKGIPVLMCTALNAMNDVEKCCAWGAAGYITKPFDLNRVLAKVNACLGTPPAAAPPKPA